MTRDEEADAIKLSQQMDTIMKNRERRFMFLTKKERVDDAIAVADEFYEWLAPEHADDDDLILYYNAEELEAIYHEKKAEARRNRSKKKITEWPDHAPSFPYRVEFVDKEDKILAFFQCEEHLNKYLIRHKLNPKNSRVDIYPEHTHKLPTTYKKPKRQLFSTLNDFFIK